MVDGEGITPANGNTGAGTGGEVKTTPANGNTGAGTGGEVKTTPWFTAAGADTETQGYLSNRGWDKLPPEKAALEAIKAHRNAEKLLGGPADRLMRIPTDPADSDGWGKVYTALGRPKDANGYDMTSVGEADPGFINFVREFAYRNNMPKAAGEALAKEVTKFAVAQEAELQKQSELEVAKEQRELRSQYGFEYDAKMLTAQNAVAKLGIDPAAVKTLEGKIGYKGVIEMFVKIGSAIGEDKFIKSEQTGAIMSPAGATERLAQLKSDPEWVKRYQDGGKKELQEMKDLIFITTEGGKKSPNARR